MLRKKKAEGDISPISKHPMITHARKQLDNQSIFEFDIDEDSFSNAESENESDNEMLDRESGGDSDSDNPDPYREEESLTVKNVLYRIEHPGGTDENGNAYLDLDLEYIANHTEAEDLTTVINVLLLQDIRNKSLNNFDIIKKLIEIADINPDEDHLDDALDQAIVDDDIKKAEFFVTRGANAGRGIKTAITKNSDEMLDMLNAKCSDEHIKQALKEYSLNALDYFLRSDFSITHKLVLSYTASLKDNDEKRNELIKKVCEHVEVSDTYDLINYLLSIDAEHLIPTLIENFEAEELLDGLIGEEELFYLIYQYYEKSKPGWIIAQLANKFKDKLNLNDDVLIFPQEKFNGDTDLKEIREIYSQRLSFPEVRAAMNYVGVALSTHNHLFSSSSPYHQPRMEDSLRYFRSDKHPITKVLNREYIRTQFNSSLPESKLTPSVGDAAHIGAHRNPHHSMIKFREITPITSASSKVSEPGNCQLYDTLLESRQRVCEYIQSKINFDFKEPLQVGYYHNYPCIMVLVKNPNHATTSARNGLEGWTHLIISYFIAMVNHRAHQQGLNIEITRRSSFGFLTPTIADCDQSFRINVGLIPTEYADILIECLIQLNAMLATMNDKSILKKLNTDLPKNCFLSNPQYKKYLQAETKTEKKKEKEKKKYEVPEAKNVIDLLWAQVDRGGYTTAHNLNRKAAASTEFAIKAYNAIHREQPKTPEQYAQIFINTVSWGIGQLQIEKNTLTFTPSQVKAEIFTKAKAKIADSKFFQVISQIITALQSELEEYSTDDLVEAGLDSIIEALNNCIKNQSIDRLYFLLEKLNEITYVKDILTYTGRVEDEFGSDSDAEDEESKTFAKKVTVQNGMRAILAAIHAGTYHLYEDYLNSTRKYPLFLHGAYYETADAAEFLAKFQVISDVAAISQANILVCDINPCINNGIPVKEISEKELTTIKVLIIDSTSSSTNQANEWVEKFKKQSQMEILIFVSSGFKHEQNGADKNPYGTIRVVTKDRKILNKLMSFIKSKEKESALESGIAHHLRREAKARGFTPRNWHILNNQKKSAQSTSELPPGLSLSPSSLESSSTQLGLSSSSSLFGQQSSTSKSSSIENRSKKEISKIYWYEDSEMGRILNISVTQHANRTQNGQPIHILGPLDNISPYGLIDALNDHNRKQGVVLIPFNLGRLHWVGLTLEYDAAGRLISANYYDPQRNNVRPSLNYLLQAIHRSGDRVQAFTSIQNEQLIRQTNGSDCGPCTIENLLAAIGHRESKETDPVGRRLRHLQLLETADNDFYRLFYQRQRLNQSSFSQLKGHGKSHLSKELKNSNQFSIAEYKELLSLGLEIRALPLKIQEILITALQPEKSKDTQEHASQLARIRTALNDHLHDQSVRLVTERFFCLQKKTTSLDAAPLKIDFNQLLSLTIILSLSKEQLSEDLKNLKVVMPSITQLKVKSPTEEYKMTKP